MKIKLPILISIYDPIKSLSMLAIACLLGASQSFSAIHIDESGWTVVTPSADSRIVYVSSSEGDDSNDGFSPETPKATFAAGEALMRDGQPDHLLLKRGDVFPASSLARWKSGRTADEPILISYYGDSGPRPVIEISGILIDHDGSVRNHLAFIGVEFYKPNSDPNSDRFTGASTNSAFRFVGGGENIIIEDCRFNYSRITVQSIHGAGAAVQVYKNVKIRRNIVTDAWTNNSTPLDNQNPNHTSGVYISGVEDFVMEENVFDHNGWSTHSETTLANLFAHNVYIQRDNGPGAIIRGNFSVRGSAHGIQARSGGALERNFFAHNAIGFNVGGNGIPTYTEEVWAFNNRAVQNVVIEGRNMHPTINTFPRTSAVWGIPVSFVGEVDIIDNIVANRIGDGVNIAIQARPGEDPVSLNLVDNIVYNWATSHGDVRDMFDPSWLDPSRNLGDYYESIGGPNDTLAFYQTLRNRGVREFPWELTAYAAISFIREGFNRPGVGGYYDYGSSNAVAATSVSLNITARSLSGGQHFELIPSVIPADAHNQGVIWSSTDPAVATVGPFGIVKARGPGTTDIIATTKDGGFTAASTVTVGNLDPVEAISIDPVVLNRIPAGQTRQLTALVSPASANQNVIWSSGNDDIATVDDNGRVTTVSPGATSITATSVESGGLTASANVIVIAGAAPLQWAGFNISGGTIQSGIRFLGTLNINNAPWIYCEDLGIWLYLPEDNVTEEGAWAYALSLHSFIRYGEAHWYVTNPLHTWLQASRDDDDAQWVYITRQMP